MKIVSIHMFYNEEQLVYKNLSNLYDIIDEMLVWEGTVSPFNDQPIHSTDNTIEEIQRFIKEKDTKNKIKLFTTDKILANKREDCEAIAKNIMLAGSSIENGDLLFLQDADEFYDVEKFYNITDMFRKHEDLETLIIQEKQHAYKIGLCFDSSHEARFLHWKTGSKYTASHHFFYPNDNRDISRTGQVWPFRLTGFHHLSYVKSPELIRQKVLSFRRKSFVDWFNHVYLVFPFDHNAAYHNNIILSQQSGWPGGGFAEGQTEKLYEYKDELPDIIKDIKDDWTSYILENRSKLLI